MVLRTLTGRLGAWLVLAVALLAGGAVIGSAGSVRTANDPTASLPAAAESTRVAALQRQLPSGRSNPALVVYSRGTQPLTDGDVAKIDADAKAFRAAGPPVYSPRRDAALIAVPLPADAPAATLVDTVAGLRTAARTGLPAGLTAQVTGGAGFAADIADSFTGAKHQPADRHGGGRGRAPARHVPKSFAVARAPRGGRPGRSGRQRAWSRCCPGTPA